MIDKLLNNHRLRGIEKCQQSRKKNQPCGKNVIFFLQVSFPLSFSCALSIIYVARQMGMRQHNTYDISIRTKSNHIDNMFFLFRNFFSSARRFSQALQKIQRSEKEPVRQIPCANTVFLMIQCSTEINADQSLHKKSIFPLFRLQTSLQLSVDIFPCPDGGYATDPSDKITPCKERSEANEYGRKNTVFTKSKRNISGRAC